MKYRIKVEPAEDYNPEFPIPEMLAEGFQVDGFLVLGYRDGEDEKCLRAIHGASVEDIKDLLEVEEDEVSCAVRAACALMDGEDKADRIIEHAAMKKAHRDLAKFIEQNDMPLINVDGDTMKSKIVKILKNDPPWPGEEGTET